MKRLFFLALFLAAARIQAEPPRPQGYVTDQARVLSAASKAQLESLLGRFEATSGVQIAVVTITSLEGNEVADYSNKLFKDWGIGKKGQDNGALFLIAPNDKRMRIETGYGLEGIIPDALAGRILDEAVAPRFRQGDLNGGIFEGTRALCQAIAQKSNIQLGELESSPNPVPLPPLTKGQKFFAFIIFILMMIVLVKNPWLLLLFLSRGGSGHRGGGFGGGGFGGFGGGGSGGGGASRGW